VPESVIIDPVERSKSFIARTTVTPILEMTAAASW